MPEASTHYPPPPLSRWQVFWRYFVAVMPLVAAVLVLVLSAPDEGGDIVFEGERVPVWMAALDPTVGVLGLVLIRFRRRWPLGILVALAVCNAFSSSVDVLASWALVALATHRQWRRLVPGVVAYFLGGFGQLLFFSSAGLGMRDKLVVLGLIAMWTGVLVSVGLFVGARRALIAALKERADTAEREQELRVLQGQAEERNRIAREMHDVLAHRLSLVSMHAGVLAFRDDLTQAETREIAGVIQENAHASLTELRGVLHSLREHDEVPTEIAKPQPREFVVDDLVTEARAGGARIDFTNQVEHPELLPSGIARHAYRIVQEALTNARKHAPGTRVTLTVRGAPGKGLTILAANPQLLRAETQVPGSQVGLVGLRERVDITGGRMAVRRDGVDFELEVWLPW